MNTATILPSGNGENCLSNPIHLPALLRQRMIVEMTYFIARKRGYAPGYEPRDWIEAKRIIQEQYPEE